MKIGVSAFAWTAQFDRRHLGLLAAIRENGIQAFEVPMFDPRCLAPTELRRAFEDNGLECTVCAILPAKVNPISPDAAVRKRAAEHLMECLAVSAEMGAKLLGGPLYAPIGYLPEHRPSEDEKFWAIEAFQSLGDRLHACQMTLSIEPVNRSETAFLRTAREAKSLCEAIGHPRIGVTIDTFHANIEEPNICAGLTSLGPWLKHVHISENDRGLLGTGHVDFPAIVASLKQSGYTGYLMIEGFGYSEEEKNGPGWLWAHEDVSPEDIAFKGARYLRNLLDS